MTEFPQHYLEEARRQFRGYKRLGEGALTQLNDEEVFVSLDSESNFVAIIVKHMAGNMRSRFTDFLTTDAKSPIAIAIRSSNCLLKPPAPNSRARGSQAGRAYSPQLTHS